MSLKSKSCWQLNIDSVLEEIPNCETRLKELRKFVLSLSLEEALGASCLKGINVVVIPIDHEFVIFKTSRLSRIGFIIHRNPFDGSYDAFIRFPFGTCFKLMSDYTDREYRDKLGMIIDLCRKNSIEIFVTFGQMFYRSDHGVSNKTSYENPQVDKPFKLVNTSCAAGCGGP